MSKIESFACAIDLSSEVHLCSRFISLEEVNYSSCGNYGPFYTWGYLFQDCEGACGLISLDVI